MPSWRARPSNKPGKIIRIRKRGWGLGGIKDNAIFQLDVKDVTQGNIQDASFLMEQAKSATSTMDQLGGGLAPRTSRISANEAQGVRLKEEAQALHTEWGMAFDERKGTVLAAAKHTGAPDQLIAAITNDEAGVDTMQWLLKFSAFVKGEGINLGGQNEGDSDNGDGKMTPSEARGMISDIQANKKHPYWNGNDPAHADALKKMVELQAAAKAS